MVIISLGTRLGNYSNSKGGPQSRCTLILLALDHTECLAHPLYFVHFSLGVRFSLVCIAYFGSFLCHHIRCSCGCYRFSC